MSSSLTISAIMNDALANAIDKGFRHNGPERTFGEEVALFHSEVSEALEHWRDGQSINEIVYRVGGKPDGVPAELADIMIRVCESCAFHELDLDAELRPRDSQKLVTIHDLMTGSVNAGLKEKSFAESCAQLHEFFSTAHGNWRAGMRRTTNLKNPQYGGHSGLLHCLGNAVRLTCFLSKFHGIDLEKAIREKVAFNRKRQFRHGGKKI